MTSICKKILGGAVLGASLLGSAQAVPLSDLLAGGSLTNGSLVFDQWSLGAFSASDGRSFDAALIDVTALDGGGLPGVNFTVGGGLLDIAGDDLFAFVDLPFGFRASATGGLAITGVRLNLDKVMLGSSGPFDGSNDNGTFVREEIGSAAGLSDLGALATEYSILDGATTSALDDGASFAARTSIWISKNTLTWALDSTDSARLLSFSQRFELAPAVPEPSTYALMGIGLGVIGLAARRRRTAGR